MSCTELDLTSAGRKGRRIPRYSRSVKSVQVKLMKSDNTYSHCIYLTTKHIAKEEIAKLDWKQAGKQ